MRGGPPCGSRVVDQGVISSVEVPLPIFYDMAGVARAPERADRAALGTLPTRAYRWCEAVTAASGLGWYVYPPMDWYLQWDGADVYWTHDGMDAWEKLEAVHFPGLPERFDAAAPAHLAGYAPPFLTRIMESGIVQIWTGLFVRTAPGWSSHIRPPANLPRQGGFECFEGIVETDHWFGALFINIRLTTTGVPVHFSPEMPLLQLNLLPRWLYVDAAATAVSPVALPAFSAADWADFDATMIAPMHDPDRRIGRYAVAARKRRHAGCPVHGA